LACQLLLTQKDARVVTHLLSAALLRAPQQFDRIVPLGIDAGRAVVR
jgi:hypothetical protein